MKSAKLYFPIIVILLFCISINPAVGQKESNNFLYGDLLPDAPELAARGDYLIGVQTLELIHKNQPDIANFTKDSKPSYDRPLKVEIWYPAAINTKPETHYNDFIGVANDEKRPLSSFSFKGRAERDALPKNDEGAFPLVIVSHGYLGSRYLMTYLTENLASKGYIVVAIHHTESTFENPGKFSSTLYHRPLDDLFILNEMAKMGSDKAEGFFAGMIDTEHTALVGYSMGGYGALNAAGAGFSPAFGGFFGQMTGGSDKIMERSLSNPTYASTVDPRIKAVVAFAPWGMARGVWDSEGLANIKLPVFFVAGDQDDISGYEDGIKAIYDGAVNANRYLLTYKDARHNVAPNPPPAESFQKGMHLDEYLRYAEPAWDQRRINNINQHFVTAFLGIHLKGKDYSSYLDLTEDSLEETWKGFKPRTSIGLELRHIEVNK
ncbi:dienelactone hydrolase [uncultured Cyclobacterium sp.]|mgnify:CR=1 FL=1|uniref:alpha/beta hydrolase family protein n=1 Tax=uncultured Cyclobacterium sp. TaxID=453820 RepID=UPI0030ED1668|tara:strand:+ start:222704 stop:224008 length:1305 start_codon:yes stop_codon:yes gene_type:complete